MVVFDSKSTQIVAAKLGSLSCWNGEKVAPAQMLLHL